jgi:uncharacterized integral membrane protein
MAIFRWVVALVFLFAMALFGVQNMEPVTIRYYLGEVQMPMFLLMGILILLGAFFSALIGIADQLKLHARIRSQARRISDLEVETASLRRLSPAPIEGKDPGGKAPE